MTLPNILLHILKDNNAELLLVESMQKMDSVYSAYLF
jgi:hypothetical protein